MTRTQKSTLAVVAAATAMLMLVVMALSTGVDSSWALLLPASSWR